MSYNEVVTAYKNNSLDISDFKEKLEKAKLLKGRSRDIANEIIGSRIDFDLNMCNILAIRETASKYENFKHESDMQLNEYYYVLLDSIKNTSFWKNTDLNSQARDLEKYKKLPINKKIEFAIDLNRKYYEYLKIQNVADIRDYLEKENLDDETIKKLQFLKQMYESIESKMARDGIYLLKYYPKVVSALLEYKNPRKRKNVKLDDFIKTKSKTVNRQYEDINKIFEKEEIKDISECLSLIQETLNMNLFDMLTIFTKISDLKLESSYLCDEYENLKKLQDKNKRMSIFGKTVSKNTPKIKQLNKQVNNQNLQGTTQKDENQPEKENKIIVNNEDFPKELQSTMQKITETPLVKEKVIPIIFSWFERDENKKQRDKNLKNIEIFLEQIKKIEEEKGTRASLFLITNANREITLKRFNEFREIATQKGMPRLIEGALGGYSSFRIDETGKIIDLAKMSDENKNKIKSVLSEIGFSAESIDEDFLRYQILGKKDSKNSLGYLIYLKKEIKNKRSIKDQPIELVSYVEADSSGIDVLLREQLNGIYNLPSYYNIKYFVDKNCIIKIGMNQLNEDIKNIDILETFNTNSASKSENHEVKKKDDTTGNSKNNNDGENKDISDYN